MEVAGVEEEIVGVRICGIRIRDSWRRPPNAEPKNFDVGAVAVLYIHGRAIERVSEIAERRVKTAIGAGKIRDEVDRWRGVDEEE